MKEDLYGDIRPYNDDEIPAALERIVNDPFFVPAVNFAFPDADMERIREVVRTCKTVDQMQERVMISIIQRIIESTINNFTAETIYDDYGANDPGASSGTKAINLLYLYNNIGNGNNLTVEEALTSADFLRFAAYTIKKYISRFRDVSKLFNIGGTDKFTPADLQHVVMLNDFESAAAVYLYDGKGQFLVDNIKLPYAETINYWQGTGLDYSFDSVSTIDVVTSEGHSVKQEGVLAILFDHDALGVTNMDRKTKIHRNEVGEFQNTWEKATAGYWNDFDEQFIVFFIAEPATP